MGSLSSANNKLALLILNLFESRKVEELETRLELSSASMKTLINFKFEAGGGKLSFMDLLSTEGHFYLLLAKHQNLIPLIGEVIDNLGNAVKNASSPKLIALYELILRFPSIYEHLLSFPDHHVINLFDSLVDYANGTVVSSTGLASLFEFGFSFFRTFLDFKYVPFGFTTLDSSLKFLAYSQREIKCCFWMLVESPKLPFTQDKLSIFKIMKCDNILSILFYNHELDGLSVDRMANLAELMKDYYYLNFLAYKSSRKIKFAKFFCYLERLPSRIIEVLLYYYLCEVREVKISDINSIIDLTIDQKQMLREWQLKALGYHDSLSDPENIDWTEIFEDLLKLGVDKGSRIYLLAKRLVPYFIDPDRDFRVFKKEFDSPEFAGFTSMFTYGGKSLPHNNTITFDKFVPIASGAHEIVTHGSFFFEFNSKLFKYFIRHFLSFEFSLEKDLEFFLWGFYWPPFKSKMFFNNLYNALRRLPYDLNDFTKRLEPRDQSALNSIDPKSDFRLWAQHLIESMERMGIEDRFFLV